MPMPWSIRPHPVVAPSPEFTCRQPRLRVHSDPALRRILYYLYHIVYDLFEYGIKHGAHTQSH